MEFHDREVELGAGDVLTLFTDGVTEARRNREMYGEARLRSCLERHSGSAATVVDALLEDVVEFQRDQLRDDVAIVSLRVLPA